jgi:enoyl-CoA hydratase/carnithine racemase
LESSGAMRYLGNAAFVKKILDYEETLKIIALLEDNISPEKAENWSLVQKVFDGFYFRKMEAIKTAARDSSVVESQEDAAHLDTFLNTNYPLITYERNTWMELSNRALTSTREYRTLLEAVIQAKQKAEEAMDALKYKYGF